MSALIQVRDPRLESSLCGIKLPNPIGLAAGFDKNCDFLRSAGALGFGYVVGGTVTEHPQPGNPRPRMLRRATDQALVNALGFPSKGLELVARRLEQQRGRMGDRPVLVSVSGTEAEGIVRCHRRLEPLADAMELNISSPNTAGLKVFQQTPVLGELLESLNDGRRKPLLVKLPPYPDGSGRDASSGAQEKEQALALARTCMEHGVDALTLANTRPVAEPDLASGSGGLSGRPLFGDTFRMVADVRAEVGERVAINACGGIFTGRDAWRAIQAGANTIQLYTALVYRGPWAVKRICRELLACMEEAGLDSLSRSPGADVDGPA